jgi:hypothetical protein
MSERYFVDERGGCIAVRDRQNTDPDYQGLHEDTAGVVWFCMGDLGAAKCPTCGQKTHGGWSVSDAQVAAARAVASSLNAAGLPQDGEGR